MRITRIDLENGRPVRVAAELSADEAAHLTRLTGKQSDDLSADVYDCLTGELFNRFYGDGVDGYLRGDETS